jgi:hypothetical protein
MYRATINIGFEMDDDDLIYAPYIHIYALLNLMYNEKKYLYIYKSDTILFLYFNHVVFCDVNSI